MARKKKSRPEGTIKGEARAERAGTSFSKKAIRTQKANKEGRSRPIKQGEPGFGGTTNVENIAETSRVGREFRAEAAKRAEAAQEAERAATTVNIVSKEEALRTANAAGAGRAPLEERGEGPIITGDVLGQLIPFSKASIGIETDNRVFNTAAEYVLNNPYAFAIGVVSIVVGAQGLAAARTGKAVTALNAANKARWRVAGIPSVAEKASGYIVNTRSTKATVGILGKIFAKNGTPNYVMNRIMAVVGTYGLAEWATIEAQQGIRFTVDKAVETGDEALIVEAIQQGEEILNPGLWSQIGRALPGTNLLVGFMKAFKGLRIGWETAKSGAETAPRRLRKQRS